MMGFVGKRAMSGFSMLRPFCDRTMAVLPTVTAGSMISATVGGISGTFFVVTRMKSKGSISSFLTSGIVFRTSDLM